MILDISKEYPYSGDWVDVCQAVCHTLSIWYFQNTALPTNSQDKETIREFVGRFEQHMGNLMLMQDTEGTSAVIECFSAVVNFWGACRQHLSKKRCLRW
jgi:hypothetical protein